MMLASEDTAGLPEFQWPPETCALKNFRAWGVSRLEGLGFKA